ncbi:MAG: methyltransferase domain-containing protein [Thermoanaerobaculia bacterium]
MKPPQYDPAWPPEVVEIWRNDLREIWDSSIERHVYNQYHNQLDLYLRLVEKYGARRVLDVGCAQGTLALLLAERGLSVTAVDIRQPFLDYARTRYEHGDVRFVAANVFDRPELGRFDLVFGNQIIEHLVYPAEFLRALAAYADLVVVSTPNHRYFRSTLPTYREIGDPREHEARQFSATGGDHFFAYAEEELRDAAEAAGLDVLEMAYFETPWISGHFMFRYLHWLPVGVLRALDRLSLRVAPRALAHQLCAVLRVRK